MKGAAHNYSTWPNEKMHGTLKNAYQDHSNGKNVTVQVGTQVNLILYILTLLTDPPCRPPLFGHEIHQGLDWCWSWACRGAKCCRWSRRGQRRNNQNNLLTSLEGHIKLGSPRPLKSIQEILNEHDSHLEFQNFRQKFTAFINQCLPVYLNHDSNLWINLSFPEMFHVRFIKIHYCEHIYATAPFTRRCRSMLTSRYTMSQGWIGDNLLTTFTAIPHSMENLVTTASSSKSPPRMLFLPILYSCSRAASLHLALMTLLLFSLSLLTSLATWVAKHLMEPCDSNVSRHDLVQHQCSFLSGQSWGGHCFILTPNTRMNSL